MVSKRIIVVDDEEIFLVILKRMAEKIDNNVEVMTYEDGRKALEELTIGPAPDIIFLDINMGQMDGWEFLENYTKLDLQKSTDIYMLSSSSREEDLERIKQYSVVKGFVMKPIHPEILKNILG